MLHTHGRRFSAPLFWLVTGVLSLAAPPLAATPQAAGPGTPRWALDLSASGLSDVDLRADAFADEKVVMGVVQNNDMVQILTPQAFAVNPLIGGTSYGAALNVDALQVRFIPVIGMYSFSSSHSRPMVLVYGIDTDTVTIVWVNSSSTYSQAEGYQESAMTNTPFSLDLYVTDAAGSAPVRYYTQYWLYTDLESKHETNGLLPPAFTEFEDPAFIRQANLFIDGQNLTADRFDLHAVGRDLVATREYLSPVLVQDTTVATRKLVEVTGETFVSTTELGMIFPLLPLPRDWSHARYVGMVRIKFDLGGGSPPGELIEQEDPSVVTYSLDIGSDSELSDVQLNGNEAWDPGDVYVFGAPNPAPGINGPWDDLLLSSSSFDYVPAAPFGATPPVPVCGGPPPGGVLPPLFMDLDGHHLLDVDLTALLPPIGAAPAQSLERTFASDALFDAWHLAVSFDDDGAMSHMDCDVPINSTSTGGKTYGRTADRDEAIAIDVDMFSVPATVLATSPLWNEGHFSADLLPNPDLSGAEDDDVDSLSLAAIDLATCPWLYFTVDHEAPGGPDPLMPAPSWDPATIYMAQSIPACGVVLPVPVLDPLVNLGLSPGTDIDAFEFAWVWDAAQSRDGLALLFSVDEDDPGTAADESGMLDPNMIYVSFLTGTSQAFLDAPLYDDVDAIGVWKTRLTSSPPVNPWISFCDASDGSLLSCPCGNAGTPDSGCDNAQGTGGVKAAVLAQTTAPNGATLQGTGFSTMGAPTAIVLRSPGLDPLRPVVFGDGLRCVGTTSLVRLAATVASGGTSTHTFGHSVMAGAGTFFYQLWYRNAPASFCDSLAAFNLSNGAQIVWW